MRKKLLYIIISLSIFVLILIAINLVDIINVKKDLIISGGKGTKSEPLVVGN